MCRSQSQYATPAAKQAVPTVGPTHEATTRSLVCNVFCKLAGNQSTTKTNKLATMYIPVRGNKYHNPRLLPLGDHFWLSYSKDFK